MGCNPGGRRGNGHCNAPRNPETLILSPAKSIATSLSPALGFSRVVSLFLPKEQWCFRVHRAVNGSMMGASEAVEQGWHGDPNSMTLMPAEETATPPGTARSPKICRSPRKTNSIREKPWSLVVHYARARCRSLFDMFSRNRSLGSSALLPWTFVLGWKSIVWLPQYPCFARSPPCLDSWFSGGPIRGDARRL